MNQAAERALSERNPFMLLMHPEVVLAAVENSERLNQLNRHLCRPLDRPVPGTENTELAEMAEGVDRPVAANDNSASQATGV
jgi:hypothetical protein